MSELQPDNIQPLPAEQGKKEPVQAALKKTPGYGDFAVLALICIAVSGGAGAMAAKYFVANAPQKPQAPQVMILDAARITDEAMKINPGNPQKAAMESIAKIKERISQFTSMGIIVIDRSSVIEAPEGAFINVNAN